MNQKSKRIAGVTAALVLAGVIGASVYDCRPPAIKYTFLDLEVPEEVAASYETLMRYRYNGTNRLNTTLPEEIQHLAGTWTDLLPSAVLIQQAWDQCTDGRQYIQDLDRFPFITDWDNSKEQMDPASYAIPDYQTLRHLTLLYSLHATLLVQQGKTEEGIHALIQHYSVIRKSLPYSTTLVTFAVNIACARLDLQTADLIIRNSACSRQELERMGRTFAPLDREEYSWFRPLLAEYSCSQYVVLMIENNEYAADSFLDLNTTPFERFALSSHILFKPNLTMRTFKKIYEPLIDACMQRKDLRPLLENIEYTAHDDQLFSRLWNPTGHVVVGMMVPVWRNVYDKTLELKTMSDLLALEIHSRLGQQPDLNDVYTGSEYRFNQDRQCFYSLGEDGLDGTADDVYINPAPQNP